MKNAVRIGRVRFKNGADVSILRRPEVDELQQDLMRDAGIISGYYKPGDIDGFFIVAWDRDGGYSIAKRISGNGLGGTLAATFVSNVLQREITETGVLEQISYGDF